MYTSSEGEVFLGGEGFVVHALGSPVREPRTQPGAAAYRSREIGRRVRAQEDAWAMHANAANGFGAGETAAWR
ncbi:MAG: hypothetical protein U1F58_19800 [Burkholderiales bacterium]